MNRFRGLSENSQQIISLVAQWRATPEALRDHKSLKALARAHGFKPDDRFMELASSAEVYQSLLVQHAGEAIDRIPSILDVCATYALKGSAKHTEIYLEWCRKLITDTTFLGLHRPSESIADTLEHLTEQIDRIADFVREMPPNPGPVSQAEPGQVRTTARSLAERSLTHVPGTEEIEVVEEQQQQPAEKVYVRAEGGKPESAAAQRHGPDRR